MPFLELPPELHLELAEWLTPSSLAALCLVNQKLQSIYVKPLYTKDSDSVLQWAVEHSNKETMETTLKYGGNVNAIYQQTETLLMRAIRLGRISIAELLLEKGADVSLVDAQSKTPLHYAIQHKQVVSARILLQHGANVNALEHNSNTPLIEAAYYGPLEAVEVLLEHGADMAHANCKGATAVYIAILKCDLEIIKLLIRHGADYSWKYAGSPLTTAASGNRLDAMKYFVEELGFTDVNATNEDGWIPLISAARSDDNQPVIEYLVEHGSRLDAVTRHGVSALMLSIRHGQFAIAKYLISKGANVSLADTVQGDTTLIDAAERGDPDVVRLLIEKGADINQINNSGWTPLFQACKFGSLDATKVLIEHGADPAEPCRCGCGTTPLQGACGQGHIEVVKYLLDLGMSPHTINSSGRTPIDAALAKNNKHRKEIVKLLEENGCVPTPQTGGVF